jgi:hypothetical protein
MLSFLYLFSGARLPMVTLRISLCGYLIEERSVESGAASGYRTTIRLKAIWQPQIYRQANAITV